MESLHQCTRTVHTVLSEQVYTVVQCVHCTVYTVQQWCRRCKCLDIVPIMVRSYLPICTGTGTEVENRDRFAIAIEHDAVIYRYRQ